MEAWSGRNDFYQNIVWNDLPSIVLCWCKSEKKSNNEKISRKNTIEKFSCRESKKSLIFHLNTMFLATSEEKVFIKNRFNFMCCYLVSKIFKGIHHLEREEWRRRREKKHFGLNFPSLLYLARKFHFSLSHSTSRPHYARNLWIVSKKIKLFFHFSSSLQRFHTQNVTIFHETIKRYFVKICWSVSPSDFLRSRPNNTSTT